MSTSLQGKVAAVVCLLALTSCTGSGDEPPEAPVVQLGAPGESGDVLSENEVAELDRATEAHPTEADVAFVQDMIDHHEQALVMTAMVTDHTDSKDLGLLAERMDISQRAEIGQLEAWLAHHGQRGAPGHGRHGQGHLPPMPGMLSDAELSQLDSARGRAFDRLFLQLMIRHHEGAVLMVNDLVAEGGAQEPSVFQLAQHIDADQRVEIARMRTLLAGLQ